MKFNWIRHLLSLYLCSVSQVNRLMLLVSRLVVQLNLLLVERLRHKLFARKIVATVSVVNHRTHDAIIPVLAAPVVEA